MSYHSKIIRVYLVGIPVPKFGVFWGFDPKMQFPINATCCRGLQEKRWSKVRYSKKSFWGYISPICGAASSHPIATIFGTSRNPADVINRDSCKISSWSVSGFRLGRCLKMACFHRKAWSSLTLCLALARDDMPKSRQQKFRPHSVLQNEFTTSPSYQNNKDGIRYYPVPIEPPWCDPSHFRTQALARPNCLFVPLDLAWFVRFARSWLIKRKYATELVSKIGGYIHVLLHFFQNTK
jgi:hypothetical protein